MSAEAEAALRDLFFSYAAGFDDADSTAIASLFAWPATIWQFGQGHIFEDKEELAENVEALMDVFEEAGIVLTTPDIRELRVIGGSGFARVAWRQENSSGEPLHEFTCNYMLLEQDGAWRIATVVNEEAEP